MNQAYNLKDQNGNNYVTEDAVVTLTKNQTISGQKEFEQPIVYTMPPSEIINFGIRAVPDIEYVHSAINDGEKRIQEHMVQTFGDQTIYGVKSFEDDIKVYDIHIANINAINACCGNCDKPTVIINDSLMVHGELTVDGGDINTDSIRVHEIMGPGSSMFSIIFDDNGNVNMSGLNKVLVPSPGSDYEAATRKYVSDSINTSASKAVTLTGVQDITGKKNFHAGIGIATTGMSPITVYADRSLGNLGEHSLVINSASANSVSLILGKDGQPGTLRSNKITNSYPESSAMLTFEAHANFGQASWTPNYDGEIRMHAAKIDMRYKRSDTTASPIGVFVSTPTENQHVANKQYVDNLIGTYHTFTNQNVTLTLPKEKDNTIIYAKYTSTSTASYTIQLIFDFGNIQSPKVAHLFIDTTSATVPPTLSWMVIPSPITWLEGAPPTIEKNHIYCISFQYIKAVNKVVANLSYVI